MSTPASRVEQVADDVYWFSDGIVSCYAIVEDGEVTLVDAGFPRSFASLVAALEQLGRCPADVTSVLVTHGHPDHLGGHERLQTHHGVTVRAHPDEQPRLSRQRINGRPTAADGLHAGVRAGIWPSTCSTVASPSPAR